MKSQAEKRKDQRTYASMAWGGSFGAALLIGWLINHILVALAITGAAWCLLFAIGGLVGALTSLKEDEDA